MSLNSHALIACRRAPAATISDGPLRPGVCSRRSDGFYIHGKVIEADYGKSDAKVFIGSQNFSNTSLNENRELGLVISDQTILSSIAKTFASDFKNGTPWPGT
jgi:phosphatidylserine/phosphatidylglycerophosphate/cardiolipin synthase-like enzyme